MNNLIERLQERVQGADLTCDTEYFGGPFPPLGQAEVAKAEADLGFSLPDTIRRIYCQVANGGFGPAYGLLGLVGGMLNEESQDACRQYKMYVEPDPNDPHWRWPKGLLPVGCLGCAMYLCVDCTHPDGPIVWFEPNPHQDGRPWDDSFFPFAETTDQWLSAWLDGEDLFEKLTAEE
jgi:hypothetical protein